MAEDKSIVFIKYVHNIVSHELFSYIVHVMLSSCSSDDQISKTEGISNNNVYIGSFLRITFVTLRSYSNYSYSFAIVQDFFHRNISQKTSGMAKIIVDSAHAFKFAHVIL